MITARQGEILNRIVQEYIKSAEPVSSRLLEKKYDFGICPASIRIEMQKLTEESYLFQPHTSSGRVPTDKGYRFFVDGLIEKGFDEGIFEFQKEDWFQSEIGDNIKFIQSLTKNLALVSDALILSYLEKEKILWKEGWEEILQEPEFEKKEYIINFTKFLKNFEEHIEDLEINSGIKIYIGRENPFKKAENFSIIISRCHLPADKGIIIISLLGPKRMNYDKNIGLINSLQKLLVEK